MKVHAIICIYTPIQVPYHYVHTKALELSLKGTINVNSEQWLIQVEGKRAAINEFVKIMLDSAEFSEIKIAVNQTLKHFKSLTINIV
ncbi:hypothetical protein CSE16_09310 [Solibacillus sp. R5-41]|uniref:hypothetical protein n=1 Tax=Solibacillus sp. R5-41 TaxID=2048654 RepID=UPI000C127351|nr:hypothetical protein [Solibacillus sp. R5-41]ATP40223.1 hypothetical protein CSE16_09310 [Solibacillus sp. R5-41]